MAHYKAHFLHKSEDLFIIRPSYMDIHLSNMLRSVIGQMQTSSQQLQIEVGRYARISLEERICQLRHQEVESEEQNICHCTFFYVLRRIHVNISFFFSSLNSLYSSISFIWFFGPNTTLKHQQHHFFSTTLTHHYAPRIFYPLS